MAATNEPKFNLPNFSGEVSQADQFFRNFKLCAERYSWSKDHEDATKPCPAAFHMAVRLTGIASLWFDNIEADKKLKYKDICDQFETRFITGESFLLLNEQFESLTLGNKDLDSFHMEIIHLGSKLKASNQTIASRFLGALPPAMKQFALTSDTHSIEAYIKKLRLLKSIQSNSQKHVAAMPRFEVEEIPEVHYEPLQDEANYEASDDYYGEIEPIYDPPEAPMCNVIDMKRGQGYPNYRGNSNFRGTSNFRGNSNYRGTPNTRFTPRGGPSSYAPRGASQWQNGPPQRGTGPPNFRGNTRGYRGPSPRPRGFSPNQYVRYPQHSYQTQGYQPQQFQNQRFPRQPRPPFYPRGQPRPPFRGGAPRFDSQIKPVCLGCKKYGHDIENCFNHPKLNPRRCEKCFQVGHGERTCPYLKK